MSPTSPATTAQELFDAAVREMAPAERLRLAALILEDTTDPRNLPGYSEDRSDEDLRDLTIACWRRVEEEFGPADDLY